MQEEINEVEFKQIVMKKLETGILVKLKVNFWVSEVVDIFHEYLNKK